MSRFVDKDNLFGDDYRAVILCEYTRDLSLIKRLIEISEKAISTPKPNDTWSYDGIYLSLLFSSFLCCIW